MLNDYPALVDMAVWKADAVEDFVDLCSSDRHGLVFRIEITSLEHGPRCARFARLISEHAASTYLGAAVTHITPTED